MYPGNIGQSPLVCLEKVEKELKKIHIMQRGAMIIKKSKEILFFKHFQETIIGTDYLVCPQLPPSLILALIRKPGIDANLRNEGIGECLLKLSCK